MLTAALLSAGIASGAQWIAAAEPLGEFDATSFVAAFTNEKNVVRAEWRVSGLGVFQAFVNGDEIGGFLKPGFTHVRKCRHVYTEDVTRKLRKKAGEVNVFSSTVTSGWWRDGVVENRNCDRLPFEDEQGVPDAVLGAKGRAVEQVVADDADNAFWGELTLEYDDGPRAVFAPDSSWKASRAGRVSSASIFGGETYDARVDESWRLTGAADWPRAKIDRQFAGEMRPSAAEVVLREDLSLTPKEMHLIRGAVGANSNSYGIARTVGFFEDGDKVLIRPGEELVVDFGQNAAAVCDFDIEGPAGAVMKVRHAEMLNEGGGDKSRGNDGPEGTLYLANLRGIPAAVRYTLNEGRQRYRPAYSFFGFRYAGITVSKPVTLRRIRSIPVTSIAKDIETGTIETGDADVNRLISNIRWGMYSNYLSVPTDCPQRDERVGWTGDTLAFLEAALYNADVLDFLSKWMDDMRDSQFPDGAFRSVAPVGRCGRCKGMSGWADAGIAVPYRLWKRYGEIGVVHENWPAMVRYLDCLEKNGGHLTNRCGDWLSFEKNDETTKKLLADAFWIADTRMMAEMAAALGKKTVSERYRRQAQKLLERWQKLYLNGDGLLREDLRTQTTLAFALKYSLIEKDVRASHLQLLANNIRSHGELLQTGFLGTAVLLDVLSDNGAHDLAVTLLLQRKNPSWLYSVDQGATTIWERWNSYTKEKGFGPAGMNSFNHYAYGAVLGWMYSSLAGIREGENAMGMKRFVLRPRPDRRLGFVKARYRSRAGVIESFWRYEKDGSLVWNYTVPEGAEAEVYLPGAASALIRKAGRYEEKLFENSREKIFPVGGITKVFTAALALSLVAEGKLDLDKPVRYYLGEEAQDVTVRQCLSCTAGFRRAHKVYPANALTVDEAYRLACREKAAYRPGTGFLYSPWGYCLAAKVIEKVEERPFAVSLSARILKPYGLADTTFAPDAAQLRRLDAKVYPWLKVPTSGNCPWSAADCGLFSTEGDLRLFEKAIAEDPRMKTLFEKQTPEGVDRSFSFGLNLLPTGEAFFKSATGAVLRVKPKEK